MPSNPPELHLPSAASCVGWMGASRRDRASSGEKGGRGWKEGCFGSMGGLQRALWGVSG